MTSIITCINQKLYLLDEIYWLIDINITKYISPYIQFSQMPKYTLETSTEIGTLNKIPGFDNKQLHLPVIEITMKGWNCSNPQPSYLQTKNVSRGDNSLSKLI